MRVIIYCDTRGVEKVELTHTTDSEREQVHNLFLSLRPRLDELGSFIKRVEAAGVADDATRD